jgi:hypothetical protein
MSLLQNLGGLAWAISAFSWYGILRAADATTSGGTTTIRGSDGSESTFNTVSTSYQGAATGFLIAAILFLLVDIVLISIGGYSLSKKSTATVQNQSYGNQQPQYRQEGLGTQE